MKKNENGANFQQTQANTIYGHKRKDSNQAIIDNFPLFRITELKHNVLNIFK